MVNFKEVVLYVCRVYYFVWIKLGYDIVGMNEIYEWI